MPTTTCVINVLDKQKEKKLWRISYVIDVLSEICLFGDEKYVFLNKGKMDICNPKWVLLQSKV